MFIAKEISDKILDYLKLKQSNFQTEKKGIRLFFECPKCKRRSCYLMPERNNHITCLTCSFVSKTIIDTVRVYEKDKREYSDNDVLEYLKDLFNIKIIDDDYIDKHLNFYEKVGFDLVPVVKNTKIPTEKDWTSNEHKSKKEWLYWLSNNQDLGVKTGLKSNLLVLDIDCLSKEEKVEYNLAKTSEERRSELLIIREERLNKVRKEIGSFISSTLTQKTLGGIHLFYKYDKDIPKTFFNIEGINIDVEAEGGYILLFPSQTNKLRREFERLEEIIELPKELKKYLLKKIDGPKLTDSETIKKDIETENFKIDPEELLLKNDNLKGCCNNSFIRLGGILRKQLNIKQTSYVLHLLNRHLLKFPMQDKAIDSMVGELDRYYRFDESELAHEILDHLKEVGEVGRNEIAMTIAGTNKGEPKKRIDKALSYLVKEGYIVKKARTYAIIKHIEWATDLINTGKRIDFDMPYFSDIAEFNWGDLLLLASKNKRGKTTISINFIRQLVNQGKTPNYISLETGSRFKAISLKLNLKEGDFRYNREWVDPSELELEQGAITVLDWLMIEEKSMTDTIFKRLVEQLYKTNGILIVFQQLKEDNTFFAPNLCKQFPSFVARYVYDSENDGTYGKWKVDDMREPKEHIKVYDVPCIYNWQDKTLTRVCDIKQENSEGSVSESG